MIVEVKAKFACDDCGTEFFVRLDPAYDPPGDWTVFDVAVDQIRGGLWYEDGNEDPIETGSGSVEEERHYCARCTRKRDAKPEGEVGG